SCFLSEIVGYMPKESPVTFKVKVVAPISKPIPAIANWFKHFDSAITPAIDELISFAVEDLAAVEHQMKNLRITIQKHTKNTRQQFAWQQTINLVWSADIILTNFKVEITGGRS